MGAHCVGVGCDQGFWVVSSNLCLANLRFLYFPFHFVVVSCSLRAVIGVLAGGRSTGASPAGKGPAMTTSSFTEDCTEEIFKALNSSRGSRSLLGIWMLCFVKRSKRRSKPIYQCRHTVFNIFSVAFVFKIFCLLFPCFVIAQST